MSGTSLDGVDLAYCVFSKQDGQWKYEIVKAITVSYENSWKDKLSQSMHLSATDLLRLDVEYGHYLGKLTSAFIQRQRLNPNLIASHGHTVFHQPAAGFTLQIGNGAALATHLESTLVFDFRSQDLALGGQGAPLVPIGDRLLFGDYQACVNLGGIANISLELNGQRRAWDIGVCNMALNYLANKVSLDFDVNGQFASRGTINYPLLSQLNQLEYYHLPYPKSLGREWFIKHIIPIFEQSTLSVEDLMLTWIEHISLQIASAIPSKMGKVLFTGGGALNTLLMNHVRQVMKAEVVIPDPILINFKEALIFAFLGALRIDNEINVLASVTGANRDHSSGSIIPKLQF